MRIESFSSGRTCLRRTGSCDGRCRQITDENDVDLEFGLTCTVEIKRNKAGDREGLSFNY